MSKTEKPVAPANSKSSHDQLIDVYKQLQVDSLSDLLKATEPRPPEYCMDEIDAVSEEKSVLPLIGEPADDSPQLLAPSNAPLLMMYVENNKALFDCSRSSPGLGFSDLRDNDRAIDRLTEDILELLIDEAITENAEVKLRRHICPHESPAGIVNADLSKHEEIYGIRTNYNAVNEYLLLLVDFLVENYASALLHSYNRGPQVCQASLIRALREYHSRYSEDATFLLLSDAEADKSDKDPSLEVLVEFRLLSDDVYEALKQEVIVVES